MLPTLWGSGSENALAVDIFECTVDDPADGHPAGRRFRPAGDALTVDADFDRSAVDTDLQEVLDDQIREVTPAESRGVEPPEFAHAHLPRVVDREPRTVVEDTKSSRHTTGYALGSPVSDGGHKGRRCR